MHDTPIAAGTTRRRFLTTSALAAGAMALPGGLLKAGATARYTRRNLSDPAFPTKVLDSYKKAIRAMLALPPTDPRNWYRNAFVHTLDCPHGNWWFVVWHRGYIGWFERTCRELSGDPDFALPYWDWTAEPRIPDAFFEDVLDPSNPAYISSLDRFQAALSGPMDAFWTGMTAGQMAEMKDRGYNSMADVWAQVKGNPMFFDPAHARNIKRSDPNLDAQTSKAVSLDTVLAALAPTDFIGFGSDKASQHSEMVGFAILEGQPHNLVHNNIGGFMQDFLSPVDPIFYMHHGNIDRLWDVWTRKQQARGLATLPTGADLTAWQNEPFLFYIDEKGKPVSRNTAGDYATIGMFDYGYQKGSGEQVVGAAASKPAPQIYEASPATSRMSLSAATVAQVKVPADVIKAGLSKDASPLYTRVLIQPNASTLALRFKVLVNAPEGSADHGPGSPHYAGTLEFFGGHHAHDAPVAFTLPISDTLRGLDASGRLRSDAGLSIHVVPESRGAAPAAAIRADLPKISVGHY